MTDTKYIFGVDLDNSTADYTRGLAEFMAENGVPEAADFPLPLSYSFDSDPGWDFSYFGGFLNAHRAAVESGVFLRLKPLDNAVESMWALADAGVHIKVVTHRFMPGLDQAQVVNDTVAWLVKHEFPYDSLCFTGEKEAIRAHSFVDDAPNNIASIRNAGSHVFVFDQLYNTSLEGARIHGWDKDGVAKVMDHREETLLARQ